MTISADCVTRRLAAALLALGLAVPSALAQVTLRPRLDPSPAEGALAPGASALDAWAALRDAEERAYSLPGSGLRSFAVRVRSPQIEQLAAERSAVGGAELRFSLWWEAPDRRRVTLSGARGELEPGLVEALTGLVEPLHELLLPVAPTRRLRQHAFLFAEAPEPGSLRCVVEARARDPEDPRHEARYTIDEQGVIVRERTETLEGDVSDYHHAYVRRGEDLLLIGVTGFHRGARVDLTIDWGAAPDGRPVPTRVTARQLDALGQPLGPIGEIEFRLSGHRLDEELPDWLWSAAPPPRR